MRKLAFTVTLLSSAFALAQVNASIAGKWKVHASLAGTDSDSACTFIQKDSELTGSCVSEQGTVQITGKVTGAKASWSFKSDYNGTPLVITYAGTLADGKIKGEADVDPFGVSGDFTATPDK